MAASWCAWKSRRPARQAPAASSSGDRPRRSSSGARGSHDRGGRGLPARHVGRRDRARGAPGPRPVRFVGGTPRSDRDRIGEGDRTRLPGSRPPIVRQAGGLHGDRSRPGGGPGPHAVQAGAQGQGFAVDRRGLGAGRGRPQWPPVGHAGGDGARDLRHRHRRRPMTVHFIGAGPGAPDLITVRGRELIARCHVCLYAGSLVPKALLDHCPAGARIVDTAPMSLDEIVEECHRATRQGHDVARLHSGDLSVWSAMGEQLRRLDEADIAYTITPGVPSFAAAAAALGQELTLPELAQSVVLTRTSGRASAMPPGETLEAFAATGATLAVHLSIHVLDKVVASLMPHYGADCPAAVVYRASWPDERVIRATLGTVAAEVAKNPIERTALIFVGKVLGARDFRNSALYDASYQRRFRGRGT